MATARQGGPLVLEPISGQVAGAGLEGLVGTLTTRLRTYFADRRLREHLAGLDDALLLDIGIDVDEIWRIRQRHHFTPRRWQRGSR
jgi:uncharacterized protein YjiS (DUF1127 family)